MLIIPANSASGGFAVDNSCRFNVGSSDRLTRTFDSGASQQKFTISGWFKNCEPDYPSDNAIFANYTDGNNWGKFGFQGDYNQLRFFSRTSGSTDCDIQLSAVSRDVSAWYHFVFAVDTTQGTSSNRIKVYVNGVQQTSFFTSSYPSLNANLYFNNAISHEIGSWNNSQFYDGYIAEFCFINNQQLDATSFGEFDADSGAWKAIDVSGLTFGTNGFYLDFEDSAALGDDVSGNGNDFTVNNLTAIDQTTDTPTNNFATLNPLDNSQAVSFSLAQGNLELNDIGTGDNDHGLRATFGVSLGKWYYEQKQHETSGTVGIIGSDVRLVFDLVNVDTAFSRNVGSNGTGSSLVYWNNSVFVNDSSLQGWGAGDIIGVAIDMDNGKLFFSINGVWKGFNNSTSDPSAGTNANFTDIPTDGRFAMPYVEKRGTGSPQASFNFGNPPYTISSGNADGNGHGNFEYLPPSGFLSLCTKNLSEILS